MKTKTDLRLAIEKLLKIKEVAGVLSPGGGSGFPEKKTAIGERISKDAKTGKMKQESVIVALKVEILEKNINADEKVKSKIAKIMKDIPYMIVYKI